VQNWRDTCMLLVGVLNNLIILNVEKKWNDLFYSSFIFIQLNITTNFIWYNDAFYILPWNCIFGINICSSFNFKGRICHKNVFLVLICEVEYLVLFSTLYLRWFWWQCPIRLCWKVRSCHKQVGDDWQDVMPPWRCGCGCTWG
jgi:hypothetical protein